MIFVYLQVIFLVLKLAGLVAWSWWWVMAPALMWLPSVLLLAFVFDLCTDTKRRSVRRAIRGYRK